MGLLPEARLRRSRRYEQLSSSWCSQIVGLVLRGCLPSPARRPTARRRNRRRADGDARGGKCRDQGVRGVGRRMASGLRLSLTRQRRRARPLARMPTRNRHARGTVAPGDTSACPCWWHNALCAARRRGDGDGRRAEGGCIHYQGRAAASPQHRRAAGTPVARVRRGIGWHNALRAARRRPAPAPAAVTCANDEPATPPPRPASPLGRGPVARRARPPVPGGAAICPFVPLRLQPKGGRTA